MRLTLSFGLFVGACWVLLLGLVPAARAQSALAPVWQPAQATGLTITALAPLDDEHIIVAGLIAGTDVNFEGIPKKALPGR